LLCLCCL